ncbi:N-6 DNA methylase [Actinomadura sp. 21ATH]|uniref:N-6 DNA methylase n=1 Tax=Actinomadura sp. 21ATH TaxID=1735444 RepID=UPI0035C0C6FB
MVGDAMQNSSARVTAAEISRLAGVTRATVTDWRQRHEDFPAPVGGTEDRPLFDLDAVRAWLRARGRPAAATPAAELRAALRLRADDGTLAVRLLPLVLATARLGDAAAELRGLPDADLASRACDAVAGAGGMLPGAGPVRYEDRDAGALRALVRCVHEDGPQVALDVLAERELGDRASTGTYQTPPRLADLMARLLAPPEGPYPRRVLDPSCAAGALLASAAEHGAAALFGQDRVPVQAQRSAVRLLLGAADADVTVRAGDSLRADAFPGVEVDGVLCNPPFADREWGHDELADDARWTYGIPPRAESELAWVQHALSHLSPGGLAVMLLPPSVASRGPGRHVRSELLRAGALRAVVALPSGIARLHIGPHLWVLERPRPGGPAGDAALFVDASDRSPAGWDELAAAVLAAWRGFAGDADGFAAEPGFARAVPVIDLLDEHVDLTPARRVRAAAAVAAPALVAAQARELIEELGASIASLTLAGAVGEWRPAGDEARAWRTATVADLAADGALTLYRAGRGSEILARYEGRAVLTGRDLAAGGRATGDASEVRPIAPTVIAAGDVLLSGVPGPRGAASRVADDEDAACLLAPDVHLIRPDAERLDPWFLAGFLGAAGNVGQASSGSSAEHVDARRLRVPLLPLDEQRRYSRTFQHLHDLRAAAREAGEAAASVAGLLSAGLTAGSLLPPSGVSA